MNRRLFFILAVLVASAATSKAETLVSNLSVPAPGGATVFTDQWLASSFTTGGNAQGYELESVTIDMVGGSGTGLFTAIYNDLVPGGQIANGLLSGPAGPGTGLFTYSSTGAILAPNTEYWLVLGITPGGSYSGTWNIAISGNETSSFGWTIVDFVRFTVSAGGPWAYGTGSGHFSVSGGVIPEPTNGMMILMAPVGLLVLRRRPAFR